SDQHSPQSVGMFSLLLLSAGRNVNAGAEGCKERMVKDWGKYRERFRKGVDKPRKGGYDVARQTNQGCNPHLLGISGRDGSTPARLFPASLFIRADSEAPQINADQRGAELKTILC
ncbi:MAG: hypothetical protein ACRD9S_26005, partial [Pyrinomonadaceae bacterium]